jgi:hypothetical protein
MNAKNTVKRKTLPSKPVIALRKPATVKIAAAKPAKKNKKGKIMTGKAETKVKVVRDSFTMPQNEYMKIAELKQICLKAGVHVKKSELLRAGLLSLSKLGMAQLKQIISQVEQVKTGRPKKVA